MQVATEYIAPDIVENEDNSLSLKFLSQDIDRGAAKTPSFAIDITKDDIDQGKQNKNTACAVTHAGVRQLTAAELGSILLAFYTEPYTIFIFTDFPNCTRYLYRTSPRLRQWIGRYDQNKTLVEPVRVQFHQGQAWLTGEEGYSGGI
jgi:hypothetical protein